jgi:glycosyltransferase involved in cell wall biosynthesis
VGGGPSIATRLPVATYVIIEDGVNGLLVAVDDEKVLASAMNDILTDRAGSRLMGDRARQTVAARFDADRIADEWLAAYRHVLSV